MRILLLNSTLGPDYLADLFIGEMVCSGKYELYTNHIPTYLFDDYPEGSRLYGRGFTAFTKIDALRKNYISLMNDLTIQDAIEKKFFDKVVFTSIWRYNKFLAEACKAYFKDDIIVLDGEDQTDIPEIAKITSYYKRELLPQAAIYCRPISFAFPSYHSSVAPTVQPKNQLLAPCVAGMRESYVFETESSYYNQYSASYFGLTTRKAGWDCMRHYEIINANCIPLFPDISEKPATTMAHYPVLLQHRANDLFEKCIKNPEKIDNFFKSSLLDVLNSFRLWLLKSGTTTVYHQIITDSRDE